MSKLMSGLNQLFTIKELLNYISFQKKQLSDQFHPQIRFQSVNRKRTKVDKTIFLSPTKLTRFYRFEVGHGP